MKEKYPNKTEIPDEDELEEKLEIIRKGFKINHLRMKDGSNGKLLWETNSFDINNPDSSENLPKEIL